MSPTARYPDRHSWIQRSVQIQRRTTIGSRQYFELEETRPREIARTMSGGTSNCPNCGGSGCTCYMFDSEDEASTSAPLTTTTSTNYLDPSQTSTADPYAQVSWQSNTVQPGVYGPTSGSYYPNPQSATASGSAFWNIVRTPEPQTAGQGSYHEIQSGTGASHSDYPTTAPEPSYEDEQAQQPFFFRTELGPGVPITEPDPANVRTSSFYNQGSSHRPDKGVQPCEQCRDAERECFYVRRGKRCEPCRLLNIRRCTTGGSGTGRRRNVKKDKRDDRRRDDHSKGSTGQTGGYSYFAV
ncbi:hypothetical protein V8F33_012521 [Rhypophila sp. PSN 637]